MLELLRRVAAARVILSARVLAARETLLPLFEQQLWPSLLHHLALYLLPVVLTSYLVGIFEPSAKESHRTMKESEVLATEHGTESSLLPCSTAIVGRVRSPYPRSSICREVGSPPSELETRVFLHGR